MSVASVSGVLVGGGRRRGGEGQRREEHGEHGWRAEGEVQGIDDYAGSTGRWERKVARYEVVCVHGGRGRFEDVMQALGGERECF